MKEIKREYKIDNSVYFNSKYGEKVLSNMYPCKLTYDGMTFNSVEQLFYYLLYHYLNDETMKCKNAFEVKELYKAFMSDKMETKGKNESKEDFEKRKRKRLMAQYDLIHKCHQVKFQQFKPFRDIIINSGDKDIVEWCYWIFDKRIDEFGTYKNEEKGVFVGGNVCGRSMMMVRKEYQEGTLKIENGN